MKKERKRIIIDGNIRRCLLAGCLMGMVIATVLAVNCVRERRWETSEEILLSYGFQNQAEYQVDLKQNPYTKEQVQGMDEAYIAKLVKDVRVQFGTSYEGDKKAALSGEYQVQVFLQGYQMNEGEKEVIWKRNVKEVEKKQIKEKAASFCEKTKVTIVPKEYDRYIELARQDLDIATSTEIVAEVTGSLRVKEKGETVTLPIEASVCIPMGQERYEIAHTKPVNQADTMVKKSKCPLGINLKKVWCYAGGIPVCIMAVVVLAWKTGGDTKEIRKNKKKEKLLQAQVKKTISLEVLPKDLEQVCKVKELQGIFWLAEELRRPVFSKETEEGIYFFVFDENKMYSFFENCI